MATSQHTESRREVSRCLASLWKQLLAASESSDGPTPESAAPHLRAAADLLSSTAARLEEVRS